MDARDYNKQSSLHQTHGFVFVTSELHEEFDLFCANKTRKYDSILRLVALLKYWNNLRPVPTPAISMYGKAYLVLSSSEIDDLCQWVYDAREQKITLVEESTGTFHKLLE